MQPEILARRFDPGHPGLVTRVDVQELLVPAQVLSPVDATDAVDGGVGFLTVTGFVPGLEAECRNAEFRSRQRFRRA